MNSIFTYWTLNPVAVLLLILLITVFVRLNGFSWRKKLVPFIILLCLLITCFFSPLHILSSRYLFSAHMIVHVILLLLVGPFMVLSLPENSFHSFFSLFGRHPLISWLAGVGIMWVWHIPVVFNKSMGDMNGGYNWMSLIEIFTLIVAGIIFSSPVIHPGKSNRIPVLTGILYLLTACIGCSVLGILISFAPAGTYHHYLSMHDDLGLNTVITSRWNISQNIDQQIAGLIMWVPCCLIYIIASMYLLYNWFNTKEPVKTIYS